MRAAGRPGRKKPPTRMPRRAEDLDPLLRARHVGDDERAAVGRDVEAARLDDAPVLLADLDQLARAAASASTV